MAQHADAWRPLGRAAEASRSVLRWWLDELRHLIPARLRQVLSADPIALQILLDDNGTDVRQVLTKGFSNVKRVRLEGPGDLPSALGWVAKRRRRWGSLMRVDIVLPAGRCLIRHRKVPRAAVERIGDVLALEIERATPFRLDVVRHAWRVIGPAPFDDTSLQLVHVIAKRRPIDPLLDEARSMGVPISTVDVVGSEDDHMGFNLLSSGEAPPSLASRLNRAIGIAAALLVLVAAATAVVVETHHRSPGSTWYVAPVAYAIAAGPGYARMYLGQHWASDIFMGSFVGTFYGLRVVDYARAHPDNRVDHFFLGSYRPGLNVIPRRGGVQITYSGTF